ncbi:MAG: AAA family ATPase [Nitrosarchaeum sp.]|nr:AAA family ATPase [Nitrosarchaeum sp.]
MTVEQKKTYTESAISDLIKDFLNRFKDSNGNYKYLDLIDKSISSTKPFIVFSPADLLESNVETSLEINDILYKDSKRFLVGLKRAVKDVFKMRHSPVDVEVYIDEVQNNVSIVQALGKEYIGKFVTLSGMITYKSDVFNKLTFGVFLCPEGHRTEVKQVLGKDVIIPAVCKNQNCKERDFEIDHENSIYENFRNIAVKSDDDFSFTNDEITVSLSGQLTEAVEAGDRIRLTGLVFAKNKPKSSIFTNEIHCLYVRKLDDIDLNITPDDEDVFRKMIDETDFYQRMINSIAPNILGNEDVKESLLLQLVRAPNRIKDDGTMVRGWFNIGLWGDAGVAKTAMAEHINENYPKTQIISSKGATDVGLTLGIDQDPSGNRVLRAGAFVLNRGYGTVILDEFPRLNPEVVDGIMTTLENGFASIAKAGFQARQRADSSCLATGNAYGEDWNDNLNLKDNLNISTPLLQRFDYHWILKDIPSKQKDEEIANAILRGIKHDDSFKPFSSSMLVKYFKFIRKCNPELSDDVEEYLKKTYVDLRADEKAKENGISPRQLNTLVRTTLAIARLYQRKFAVIEDAEKAISLIKKNLSQRGISISEADTYTNRQFKRCIEILKDISSIGIGLEDLFEKLLTTGSKEAIDQTILDLGKEKKLDHNKKWRNVVSMLRRSHTINIISEKPMIIAYKHERRS